MKILFLVQGEGRGHLTQAISMSQILRKAGHEVAAAMVGVSPGRVIPAFFEEQVAAPVFHFSAPNIVYNSQVAGIDLKATVYNLFKNHAEYLAGLRLINNNIEEIKPDLIISFYETFSGLYNVLYRSKIPMICIAHQYLLLHPRFIFPKNSSINQLIINFNSKLTSWLSAKRLALSFREIESRNDLKITVVPPLLRREVVNMQAVSEDFFLVYMTHHSLSKQIIEWHLAHPEVRLHCFWDNAEVSDEFVFDETLTFHRINSKKYLQMLASCKALVTTAGFESVCEAMYLGKPVMMVPVPNHFEQECNAMDGVISGAGVTSKTFDLSIMLDYLPKHMDQSQKFRSWYHRGEAMFLKEIEAFGKKNKATVS
ncbi:glycosyltransferase family protein [Dyadobacter fanqingshengii]|uniref:Glycosyl transferase n=1 Tax=Dyadobacter fanqingshengii TaxID=2906443 RepID=A0A9X1PCH9_9BACT|nr:glycosyltransferase family protein [Dyadobacter fanqingshengii]MCF0042446.1 glycosyl transferase [Dyadobacter fanqingshengii]USJ35030.1 glycosyl transferase [Dyadobacter fanqingshengii]